MSQRINYESPHANRYCGRSRTQKSLRTCVFCSCLGTLCRVCTRILAQDQPWGRDELTESGGRLLLSVVGVCCLVCRDTCISMLMGFGPGVCLCVWFGAGLRYLVAEGEGKKEEKKEGKRERGVKFAERLQTRLLCLTSFFHLTEIARVAVFDAKSLTARTPQAERHVFEEGDGRRVPDASVNGIEWPHRFQKGNQC